MKKFFKYARRHWKLYLISFLMLGLGVGFDAIIPFFTQALVDDVMIGKQAQQFLPLLFSMLGCFIALGLCGYIQEYTSDKVGWSVVRDSRIDLFEHIENQDQTFFRENSPGELMSRVKR